MKRGLQEVPGAEDDQKKTKATTMDLEKLGEQIARRVAEIEERDRIAEGSNLPERLRLLKAV